MNDGGGEGGLTFEGGELGGGWGSPSVNKSKSAKKGKVVQDLVIS